MSSEIETGRFAIFKENIAKIEKHNYEHAIGIHSYTLGVNQFAVISGLISSLGFLSNRHTTPFYFLRTGQAKSSESSLAFVAI